MCKVLCQCSVSQFSLANKFPFQKIILVIKHNGALARSQVSCKNCKSHLFLHEECLWLLLPHLHWHNAVINMAPALSTLLLHKRSVGTRKCNSIQILSIKLIGKCNIYYRINLENKWQGSYESYATIKPFTISCKLHHSLQVTVPTKLLHLLECW